MAKCAFCGAKIEGRVDSSYFTYHGPDENGVTEIKYEWWNKEDYCLECSRKIFRLFCECVDVFPERYDREKDDSSLKAALEQKNYGDWW